MRPVIVLSVLALALPLGGCHLRHSVRDASCSAGEPYLKAQPVPLLKPAEGLAAANTHNALKVPDTVAAPAARTPRQGCLDLPPSFYADRPKPNVSRK